MGDSLDKRLKAGSILSSLFFKNRMKDLEIWINN